MIINPSPANSGEAMSLETTLHGNSRTGDDSFTYRMLERERLRRVIRDLSTGPNPGHGDADDFARRHGFKVDKR